MAAFFTVILWLGAIYGLLRLVEWGTLRLFLVESQAESLHFVQTDDDCRLGLARWAPLGGVAGPPVLLIPPLGFSGLLFELGEVSAVTALREAGCEVWILDPRGRGWSSRPRFLGGRRDSSLDELAQFDLPAALAKIHAVRGEPAVVVGMGAGGCAALASWGLTSAPLMRGVVALGACAYFSRQEEHLGSGRLWWLARLPTRMVARLSAPLLGRWDAPWLRPLQVLDNIDARLYRRAIASAYVPASRRELGQLARWIQRDEMTAEDEGPDYRAALSRVDMPVLLVAGVRDLLAPPSMVQATRETLGDRAEIQMLVASRRDGMSVNYGHLDLVIGRRAGRELWPRIAQWLLALDPARHGHEADVEQPLPDQALGRSPDTQEHLAVNSHGGDEDAAGGKLID